MRSSLTNSKPMKFLIYDPGDWTDAQPANQLNVSSPVLLMYYRSFFCCKHKE